MKTLDRYIIRNFLYSYLLCFLVMMGLRIVADLFVNIDEFAELDLSAARLIAHVTGYYACNSLVYFQELGGVILVAGAAFSLARMNHTNELVAVLASGMSLYRVILPVLLLAVCFALVGTVNQEVFIPSVKDALVGDRDESGGGGGVGVNLITDAERNTWYSRFFRLEDDTMTYPLVICRDLRLKLAAKLSGRTGVYEAEGRWRLSEAIVAVLNRRSRRSGGTSRFIWTPRSAEVLARSGSGVVDDVDGMRIHFDRVDPVDGWLVRPRFDMLAPAAAGAAEDERRVFGTFVGRLAWYGPAGAKDREKGWRLVGPAELRARDVTDWPELCRRLAHLAGRGEDSVGGRLWARLDASTRDAVVASAKADRPRVDAELKPVVTAGLNDAIGGRLLAGADEVSSMKLPLPPADLRALADRPQALSGAQTGRINRFVVDSLLADTVIPCQGALLVPSSLTPDDIALRRTRKWLDYLSSREIGGLLTTGRITDPDSARLIQHIRVAAPVINVIMLMLSLPFIVSRERHIKSSALLCVAVVGGFHVFVFVSRYLGAEIFAFISDGLVGYGFGAASPIWGPILAASMPVLVFGPVSMLMLMSIESMERPDENRTLAQILGTLEGRLDRRTFWLRGLLPVGAVCVGALFIDAIVIRRVGLLTWAALIAAAWPVFALLIKRAHDRGRPGTFLLALLIPILGWLWVAIDLMAFPGDKEPNSYGPVPAEDDARGAQQESA